MSLDPPFTFSVTRSRAEYHLIRNKIAAQMAGQYDGWNDTYDRQFDQEAVFWFLKDSHQSIVAAVRLILATTPDIRLPAEAADEPLTKACIPTFAGEYSGIWFTEVTYAKALLALGAQWLIHRYPDYLLFAIFDPENAAARRLYLRTLRLQLVDHRPILYQSFVRKSNGRPVAWTIAADDPEGRASRVRKVMESGPVREIVESVKGTAPCNLVTSNCETLPMPAKNEPAFVSE